MAFFVYIMTNRRNGTLYVGSTDDIARRVSEHKAQVKPGFTKTYRLTRLVHVERFETREEAQMREARLKRWLRAWKVDLIEGDNPDWADLADKIAPF